MNKIIIYGIGPFAELLHYYLIKSEEFSLEAFCADQQYISKSKLCGIPVIPFEEIEKAYPPNKYSMLVAIGYSKMRNRKIIFDNAKSKGYNLINYIHPSINIKNTILGENNIFLADITFEPNINIGNNNIFWSKTLIGHNCTIGNHNHIAGGSVIAGNVTIKDLCFIGVGAKIVDSLKINNETQIIAGSTVFKDTEEFGIYYGNPARCSGYNKSGIEIT